MSHTKTDARFRQVTLYVDPLEYERVRCAAYTLGEDIYLFVGEALRHSVERRLDKKQRAAVELTAVANFESVKRGKTNKNGARRAAR